MWPANTQGWKRGGGGEREGNTEKQSTRSKFNRDKGRELKDKLNVRENVLSPSEICCGEDAGTREELLF